MGIVLTIFAVGVTFVSPLASLMLFVVLAPFGVISDFTGIDFRTYWALALAIYVAFHQLRYKPRIPAGARLVWCLFTGAAAVVLWMRGANLEPAEFEKARFLFQYFIVGSFSAAAIIELPRTWRNQRLIAYAFTLAVAWTSVVCIAEGVLSWHAGTPHRVTGTLGNPNYMAAFLAICATSLLLLQSRDAVHKWHAYPVVLMAWIACGFTMSRTGLLTAVVGFVLHRTCMTPHARRLRQLVISSFVIGSLCLLLAFYMTRARAEYESAPLTASQESMAHLAQSVSDLGRLEVALYAVKLFRENPAFGVGFATLTARNYDENGIYLTTHDTYLQLLTGTGIVGSMLFAIVVCKLMRNLPRGQRLYLLPVGACFCVIAFSGDYLQSVEMFVALAVCYSAALPLCVQVPLTAAPPSLLRTTSETPQ